MRFGMLANVNLFGGTIRGGALMLIVVSGFACSACAEEKTASEEKAVSNDTASTNVASTDTASTKSQKTSPSSENDTRDKSVPQVATLPTPGAKSKRPAAQQAVPDKDHPLLPAIAMAKTGLAHINKDIKDYSCILVKQERVDGELLPKQYIYMKVRHEPLSVYMYFHRPSDVKGRECLYVQGMNDSKLTAHEGSSSLIPMTVDLDPNGFLAMRGQRYPITEVGIKNLTALLVEVAENDLKHDECEVTFKQGGLTLKKGEKRPCTIIEVNHPVPRKHFRYHIARIAIDDEMQVPVYYAAYLWPTKPGGKPVLDETYTYTKLKLNQGFTDKDFDRENPDYNF
jgi:hypothetical protein